MVKKYFVILILLGLLFVSYRRFQSYYPQTIKNTESVKGIASKREIVPYPKNSEVVSETFTENYDQVTLKTLSDYKKVREFYKNILLESGWRLKTEETNDIFNILRFKKDKTTVTITSTISQEEGKTILSVHIDR